MSPWTRPASNAPVTRPIANVAYDLGARMKVVQTGGLGHGAPCYTQLGANRNRQPRWATHPPRTRSISLRAFASRRVLAPCKAARARSPRVWQLLQEKALSRAMPSSSMSVLSVRGARYRDARTGSRQGQDARSSAACAGRPMPPDAAQRFQFRQIRRWRTQST